MFILPTSQEIIQRSVVPERISSGIGLTERQISQLPTIKFQPSIEDKKYSYFLSYSFIYIYFFFLKIILLYIIL